MLRLNSVTLVVLVTLVTLTPVATVHAQAAAPQTPDTVQLVRDVVYATATTDEGEPVQLMLDAAFPKQSGGAPLPAVVYIHGGGYYGGSKRMGLPFTVAFARGGYFAATISYRLAGAARYPAAVHDCKAAVRFLRSHAGELAIDPDRIGVWGHSAGGHLSALLAVTGNTPVLDGELDEPDGPGGADVSSRVCCAVSVSGPTDFLQGDPEAPGRRYIENWFGATGDRYLELAREASPVTWVDPADPPLLLVHGQRDRLVPVDQSRRLEQVLRDAGVSVELMVLEDQGHMVAAPAAYLRIAEFFDARLGGEAAAVARETGRQPGVENE